MPEYVAIINASYRPAGFERHAGALVAALRAMSEIATLRVDSTGATAVFTLDLSAPTARQAAEQAAILCARVSEASRTSQEDCTISIHVEDGHHEFTGLREVFRTLAVPRATGVLQLLPLNIPAVDGTSRSPSANAP